MEVKINIEKLIEKIEITTLASNVDTKKTIGFAMDEALNKSLPKFLEKVESAVREAVKAAILESNKNDDILIEICLDRLKESPI